MMLTGIMKILKILEKDFQNNDMYLKASEQALPVLHKGDTLTVTRTNITNGKTKAPARFTEATLLVRHGESGTLYVF